MKDARLRLPLFVAYTRLDRLRPIARASAMRGTTYTVARLDPHVGGQVVISDTILAEPIDVQAAVLAHELYHSQSPTQDAPRSAAACVSEEVHAMGWEAYAYANVTRTDPTETVWTRSEEHRMEL